MAQAERSVRSGKGFDQETHYMTYLFTKMLLNKEFDLFNYPIKNVSIKLTKMELQTNDPLDDGYIEFEINGKISKACIDAKSSLTFGDINKNNNTTISKLIKNITTSISNKEDYDFYMIPFTTLEGKKTFTYWFDFHLFCRNNDFYDFKKELNKSSDKKKEFIENFKENYSIGLEDLFLLFKKTYFFTTDLTNTNSVFVRQSISDLKEYFSLNEDYQGDVLYQLAYSFISNSKYITKVNANNFIEAPTLLKLLRDFKQTKKQTNNIEKNKNEKEFTYLINKFKKNNYDPSIINDYIDDINNFKTYTKENLSEFLESIAYCYQPDKFHSLSFINPLNNDQELKDYFINETKNNNTNKYPEWFDLNIVNTFYEYLYLKKHEDNYLDTDSFIHSENYKEFFELLNKLSFNEIIFKNKSKTLNPIFTWMSLLSIENHIIFSDSEHHCIIPTIFKSTKLNNDFNPINIVAEYNDF
jgi:hypothetical protein